MLPHSKANGLECGYFQLSIKFQGDSLTINSCILFNKDFYSQIEIPKEYYSFIKEYMELAGGSFTIEIHDTHGNTFNFDPEKEPDDPDEEEDQHEEEGSKDVTPGKSSFISISKFILILIGLF